MLKFSLVVSPGSKKLKISENLGIIKIHLVSQPIEGKANAELISILAQALKLPKSAFEISKGATSKVKTILINTNLSSTEVSSLLLNYIK